MDLVKFFKENFDESKDKYYVDFYKDYFIKNLENLECVVSDEKELIERWKEILYPSYEYCKKTQAEFAIITYWLYKNGFSVKGHPNILEVLKNYHGLSNGEIRDGTRKKFGTKPDSFEVRYHDRRVYLDELPVERVNRK